MLKMQPKVTLIFFFIPGKNTISMGCARPPGLTILRPDSEPVFVFSQSRPDHQGINGNVDM
jgi:hypothetical protein